MKLTYLAGPYGDQSKTIMDNRYYLLAHAMVYLMRQGNLVHSPVVSYHHLVHTFTLPTDWDYWEGLCKAYLSISDRLIIFTINGWDKSVGVKQEIALAKEQGIKIQYMDLEYVIKDAL